MSGAFETHWGGHLVDNIKWEEVWAKTLRESNLISKLTKTNARCPKTQITSFLKCALVESELKCVRPNRKKSKYNVFFFCVCVCRWLLNRVTSSRSFRNCVHRNKTKFTFQFQTSIQLQFFLLPVALYCLESTAALFEVLHWKGLWVISFSRSGALCKCRYWAFEFQHNEPNMTIKPVQPYL